MGMAWDGVRRIHRVLWRPSSLAPFLFLRVSGHRETMIPALRMLKFESNVLILSLVNVLHKGERSL